MILSNAAVLACEPMRAALAEDDVSWDDILFYLRVKLVMLSTIQREDD